MGWHRVGPVGGALLLLVLLTGCTGSASPGTGPRDARVQVAQEIDGDSFHASDGREYRVGMVNTPERSTCGAEEASRRAYELLDDGFVPEPYAVDDHGRTVARITVDAGDLGVVLAQEGLADDRYLDQFRHQHPSYAAELDTAFALAREQGSGLWATCWAAAAAPQPLAGGAAADADRAGPVEGAGAAHTGTTGRWACHPAYRECLPDGPDLDCADVGHQVGLLGQADPYRLDGNSTTATDGVGCDTYGPWAPGVTYGYAG